MEIISSTVKNIQERVLNSGLDVAAVSMEKVILDGMNDRVDKSTHGCIAELCSVYEELDYNGVVNELSYLHTLKKQRGC